MSTAPAQAVTWTPQDYKSDYKPIWCPGCGDYSVLSSVTKAFAALQLKPEDTVVVSGIGLHLVLRLPRRARTLARRRNRPQDRAAGAHRRGGGR